MYLLRLLLEYVTMLAILVYSLVSSFYLIALAILNISFIYYLHDSIKYYELFALGGVLLTSAHYTFIIMCMTSTRKLIKISDVILSKLPFYKKIKGAKKGSRTALLIVHFIQIVYMMAILSLNQD